MKRNLTKIGGN